MARIPKPATGTYNGKPFVLLDQVVRTEEDEHTKWVIAYVIEFLGGNMRYVWADDPLLKFDSTREEKDEN